MAKTCKTKKFHYLSNFKNVHTPNLKYFSKNSKKNQVPYTQL